MPETVGQNKGMKKMNPSGKGGFTLIEVLVSLVILAFGMLAAIVGIMAGIDQNMRNEMRNDAMKIAQEQEEAVRNMPYAGIQNLPTTPQIISRQVRKNLVNYTVTFAQPTVVASPLNAGMTLTQFTVQWAYKTQKYSYVLQTVVRQMQ
jgi:prepilin-type N-terminal cleavage/methylation domain-containing protein